MGDDAEREILLTRVRALLNDPLARRIMGALVALGGLGAEARDELRRAEGLGLARHGAALWDVALAWLDAEDEDATPPAP